MSLPWVAGVDGCKAGWFVVLVEHGDEEVLQERYTLCPSFSEVVTLEEAPEVVAVDVPIGLLEERSKGGRGCDKEARRLLGEPRRRSVFSPPVRVALPAKTFDQAQDLNGGMNKQTYCILPKIREVDRLMTPELQQTVCEVHPEVSFCGLAGTPMHQKKKSAAGKAVRLLALQQWFARVERARRGFKRSQVASDDIIDAYVAAWTAMRIAKGRAERLPRDPPTDARGLRMEIWY